LLIGCIPLAIAAGWLLPAAAFAGDVRPSAESPLIAAWSNPDRLSITGAKTFTRSEILVGLAADIDVQLAASRQSSSAEYLYAVQDRIQAGYEHAGFGEVRVDCNADSDSDRILVRINEGPRYLCGDIRVVGAVRVPVDELVRRLRQPAPPLNAKIGSFDVVDGRTVPRWVASDGSDAEMDDPMWSRGDPAAFDRGAIQFYRDRIARSLDDLGFPAAKFRIELERDQAAHSVTLAIFLSDEGPDSVVVDIVVLGNHINSDTAICDYLGIRPGIAYSGDAAAMWSERLWHSGRFVSSEISAEPRSDDHRRLRLRISVVEFKKAPPLDKPLSAEAAALLKFGNWLNASPHRDDDMVVELIAAPSSSVATVVVSRHGILVFFREPKLNPDGSPLIQHAWVAARDHFAWYSMALGTKFVAKKQGRYTLTWAARCCVTDDADQKGNLRIGAGFLNNRDDAAAAPLKLTIGGDPCAFIDMAQSSTLQCSIAGGVLAVQSEEGLQLLRIDAATGRLLNDSRSGRPEDGMRFWFERGKFQSTLDQIEKTAARFPNRFDPKRAFSSLVEMTADNLGSLAQCTAGGPGPDPNCIAAWKKLLSHVVFKSVDDWLASEPEPDQDADRPGFDIQSTTDSSNGTTQALSPYILLLGNECFVRGAWPWVLNREVAFLIKGTSEKSSNRLTPVYNSRDTGPLCCLAFATMFAVGGDTTATAFAKRGLERLSLASFRADCRPMLDQRYALGKTAFAFAGALRSLSEEETEALCSSFSTDASRSVRDFAAAFRVHPDAPLADALPAALDSLWLSTWREKVRAALQTLSVQ